MNNTWHICVYILLTLSTSINCLAPYQIQQLRQQAKSLIKNSSTLEEILSNQDQLTNIQQQLNTARRPQFAQEIQELTAAKRAFIIKSAPITPKPTLPNASDLLDDLEGLEEELATVDTAQRYNMLEKLTAIEQKIELVPQADRQRYLRMTAQTIRTALEQPPAKAPVAPTEPLVLQQMRTTLATLQREIDLIETANAFGDLYERKNAMAQIVGSTEQPLTFNAELHQTLRETDRELFAQMNILLTRFNRLYEEKQLLFLLNPPAEEQNFAAIQGQLDALQTAIRLVEPGVVKYQAILALQAALEDSNTGIKKRIKNTQLPKKDMLLTQVRNLETQLKEKALTITLAEVARLKDVLLAEFDTITADQKNIFLFKRTQIREMFGKKYSGAFSGREQFKYGTETEKLLQRYLTDAGKVRLQNVINAMLTALKEKQDLINADIFDGSIGERETMSAEQLQSLMAQQPRA